MTGYRVVSKCRTFHGEYHDFRKLMRFPSDLLPPVSQAERDSVRRFLRNVSISESGKLHSSTVTNSIAFPWLRGVPEGISSGTWGQTDPAGSLLASDSVRRRKRERKTRTGEAVREGRLMESLHVASGWAGRTNNWVPVGFANPVASK